MKILDGKQYTPNLLQTGNALQEEEQVNYRGFLELAQ